MESLNGQSWGLLIHTTSDFMRVSKSPCDHKSKFHGRWFHLLPFSDMLMAAQNVMWHLSLIIYITFYLFSILKLASSYFIISISPIHHSNFSYWSFLPCDINNLQFHTILDSHSS